MAPLRPGERTQLYRTLALIALVLAATGLLSIIAYAIDLGAFGGPHHPTTGRRIFAAIVGNGLFVLSIVSSIAAHRAGVARTAARRCITAYALLAAGIAALLWIPD